MSSHVTATFKTRAAAESALRGLERLGIKDSQIGLLATDTTRGSSFNIDEHTKAEEGTAIGAAIGGLAGVALSAFATASTIVIPGLNLVVSGVIVSALAGLGVGAVTGGLVGSLVGLGVPEHEATLYENEIKNGAYLLAVKPKDKDQRAQIKNLLTHEDAYHLAA